MAASIYTIGHSTRTSEAFVHLLQVHGVQQLCDVRTIAKSRRNPQFAEAELAATLTAAGILYRRMQQLGGLRHTHKDSPNAGWRNLSFRGYADYMQTAAFAEGLAALETLARETPTAIMCAEAVPWRCHRSLIGDALVVRGWQVWDILSEKAASPHRMTPFLQVVDGHLLYPATD